MKTKNVALQKLMNKQPSIPLLLSRRGPRGPSMRLSQHYIGPKKTFCHLSNFCRKKVSWLDKKAPVLFCVLLGVVICKNHLAKPLNSFNRCRKIISSCQETLFYSSISKGPHFLFSCPLRWLICIWAICLWNKFDEKAQCGPVQGVWLENWPI